MVRCCQNEHAEDVEMTHIGIWSVINGTPVESQTSAIEYEQHLEDWIERDPSLLESGLCIVARQLRTEGGPLDLLAIDRNGQWVLIEIKRDRLRREVIAQAIDYASCLQRLSPDELVEQSNTYLETRGTNLKDLLSARDASIDDLSEGVDPVIYLVGTSIDANLERMVDYLSERAGLEIRVITFTAYRSSSGETLLAREIHEQTSVQTKPTSGQSKATSIEDLLATARTTGTEEALNLCLRVGEQLGLHLRPYKTSAMFAPPANKTRCLFTIWVGDKHVVDSNAKLWISHDSLELFYGYSKAEIEKRFGPPRDHFLDIPGIKQKLAVLKEMVTQADSSAGA
tara:strand:+ start:53505 stop:54527 length:1023 start_codon:yes stop_codon:yes gene_type:complete